MYLHGEGVWQVREIWVCCRETEALEISEKFVMDRITGSPASWQIQQSFGSWITSSCSGLRYVNNGIIFPGQSKTKGEQKNHKDLHAVRIRKRMVREGQRNGKKCSWSNNLGESSLPHISYFSSYSIWFWAPLHAQDQSGGGFFSCEITLPSCKIRIQVSTPWFGSRVSDQEYLVGSFPWISLLQKCQSKTVTVCKWQQI